MFFVTSRFFYLFTVTCTFSCLFIMVRDINVIVLKLCEVCGCHGGDCRERKTPQIREQASNSRERLSLKCVAVNEGEKRKKMMIE